MKSFEERYKMTPGELGRALRREAQYRGIRKIMEEETAKKEAMKGAKMMSSGVKSTKK